MNDFDLIIGIHSVVSALENPKRSHQKLVVTEDGLKELKKRIKVSMDYEMVNSHKLQELSKKYFKELSLEPVRVPSGVFLVSSALEFVDIPSFYSAVESRDNLRILCLDQVTDVHNAAAILRTASFYGVDFIIVPDKKSFGLTPSFFRIASGATEYVSIVPVGKLTKTVSKLSEFGVKCVALTEHVEKEFSVNEVSSGRGVCLILGREDTGISNAVLRVSDFQMSLASQGDIKSLNVSIASAVSMEKLFGDARENHSQS